MISMIDVKENPNDVDYAVEVGNPHLVSNYKQYMIEIYKKGEASTFTSYEEDSIEQYPSKWQ